MKVFIDFVKPMKYPMVMDTKKYKNTFELNVLKVRYELFKIDKSKAWLAGQIGVSRQNFHYCLRRKGLQHVETIAGVFKINVNDLLSAKL
jgi:hypothetical protein